MGWHLAMGLMHNWVILGVGLTLHMCQCAQAEPGRPCRKPKLPWRSAHDVEVVSTCRLQARRGAAIVPRSNPLGVRTSPGLLCPGGANAKQRTAGLHLPCNTGSGEPYKLPARPFSYREAPACRSLCLCDHRQLICSLPPRRPDLCDKWWFAGTRPRREALARCAFN